MKIRIGIGAGRGIEDAPRLDELLLAMEAHAFDSIWCSEILTGGGLDPLAALAYAGARAARVKLGTTMLLPGRHLLRLAKTLASVDQLSGGRLLVTFVPGQVRTPEREAIGVAPRERAAMMEAALPLLRALLAGEVLDYSGPLGELVGVRLSPVPRQQPLEFWLGGMVPASLERCGRLGDGWLPSACTPEEAAAGREVIEGAAERAGRVIDPEHFGVSIAYLDSVPDPAEEAQIAARARGRDPKWIVPVGHDEVRRLLEAFIDVGFSKFVLRPMRRVASFDEELGALAGAVGALQS